MTDDFDAPARVARGAALLDAKVPGWVDMIDLAALDVGDGFCCPLGQTAGADFYGNGDGSYYEGKAKLGLDDDDAAAMLGFFADDSSWRVEGEYGALTAEWRRVIEARRAAVQPTGATSITRSDDPGGLTSP